MPIFCPYIAEMFQETMEIKIQAQINLFNSIKAASSVIKIQTVKDHFFK